MPCARCQYLLYVALLSLQQRCPVLGLRQGEPCRFDAASFCWVVFFFSILLKALGLLSIIFVVETFFFFVFKEGAVECLTEARIAEAYHPVPGQENDKAKCQLHYPDGRTGIVPAKTVQ